MKYCLHREHTLKGTPAWFIPDKDVDFCPQHEPQEPKRRMRLIDGKWREVGENRQ